MLLAKAFASYFAAEIGLSAKEKVGLSVYSPRIVCCASFGSIPFLILSAFGAAGAKPLSVDALLGTVTLLISVIFASLASLLCGSSLFFCAVFFFVSPWVILDFFTPPFCVSALPTLAPEATAGAIGPEGVWLRLTIELRSAPAPKYMSMFWARIS